MSSGYYLKNKEIIIDRANKYYLENKDKVLARVSEYQKNNKELKARWAKKYRDNNKNKRREWIENNRDMINKKVSIYSKKRRKEDINFKIATSLRSRLYKAVKGITKNGSSVKDLGCSLEELKTYISSKFIDGMNWNNYGLWHIDHVIPLSKFDLTKKDEFLKAVCYTNLQPLWARDNILKRDTI